MVNREGKMGKGNESGHLIGFGRLKGVPQKSAKLHGRNVNKTNLFYYKQYALSLVTSVAHDAGF